jgi:hypothetical protein
LLSTGDTHAATTAPASRIREHCLLDVDDVSVGIHTVGLLPEASEGAETSDHEWLEKPSGVMSAGLALKRTLRLRVLRVSGELAAVGFDDDRALRDVDVVTGADLSDPVGVFPVGRCPNGVPGAAWIRRTETRDYLGSTERAVAARRFGVSCPAAFGRVGRFWATTPWGPKAIGSQR